MKRILGEWPLRKIGEVCSLRREPTRPEDYPSARYVGLEHIDPASPRLTRWGDPSEVRSAKSRFYFGDVLYGKLRPYLDKGVLAERPGICSTDILVIKPSEEILSEFLVYLVHSERFMRWAISTQRGVHHPRTSWSSLSKLEIPLPPLPEQRAIARALGAVQAAKEARRREAELERERKQALMRHLFTHGTRGEPTKQTEIGEMPRSWNVQSLSSLCSKTRQKDPRKQPAMRFRYIDVASVSNKTFTIIDAKILPGQKAPSRARKLVRTDDVIFATVRPTLRRIAEVSADLQGEICSTGFCVLRAKREKLNSTFLYFYMLSDRIKREVDRAQDGATYPAIREGDLFRLDIPLPSLDEQREVVQPLRAAQAKAQALDREAALLDELFRAMLEELMSGRLSAEPLIERAEAQAREAG